MNEPRKWTLVVHGDDPHGAVYGVERGHTDTGAPEGFEAVFVVETGSKHGERDA
jgi:hypothetical protein